MATKRFAVNEDPHVAEIGANLTLVFRPEAGLDFLDAYAALKEIQSKGDKDDPSQAKAVVLAVREFLADVADEESAARLRDHKGTPIPLRVLTELVEWLTQEYTGSTEDGAGGTRPTGSRRA